MGDAQIGLASNACMTCRKQKRRCTRELPACSLCKKSGRGCMYRMCGRPPASSEGRPTIQAATRSHSQSPTLGGVDVAVSLPPTPSTTTAPVSVTHDFPALFFLDFTAFQTKRQTIQIASVGLPSEYSRSLQESSPMFDVDVYFNLSVHTFLPIVSKLRLYQELTASQDHLNADLALLLIAMQLHTKPPNREEPPNVGVYRAAKASCSFAEMSNVFSVRLLQATLLIALYEIEHAIYPAAYLTVGHCARLGLAMGLHDRKRAPQMLNPPTTASDWEERRRTWWAVIMLDRYINLGSSSKPFACEDARADELLPVDEKNWDRGELALVQPLAVSTNTAVQASPFARTCQASHILSRVLRHINDREADDEFRYQEATQLHRTLQALSTTIVNESSELLDKMNDSMADLPLFTSLALCYSALLSLYELYCCVETAGPSQIGNPSFLEISKVALEGHKEISYKVYQLSQRVKSVVELGGMLRMPPFVCDCLYQAGANYAWMVSEMANDEDMLKLTGIKNVLEMLGKRWKCAREYLDVIDNYDHADTAIWQGGS
ncbi:hypothetical protein B0T10DRAFT_295217 [Thelonectria olida]|uniref:Zn(2)-C6 fungal-type domain-containing protein n=1 Tax=Thelonectria olida TaxID=1576542 RepID=A0A9P8W7P1_9HYPO|nr:hypothetical protein B0T10DRAFT_295217 [Thelonectria olida]